MNVLVLGADGFIGRAVVRALAARGIEAVRGVRRSGPAPCAPATRTVVVDFDEATNPESWRTRLLGIDAVINAVGVFRASARTFERVHGEAPVALFEACTALGVAVVQVSALGAAADADTLFLRSKNRADEALLGLRTRGVVIQPSLVFGTDGASSKLLLDLAALPVWVLPGGGEAPVQPLHVDDLAEAIAVAALSPHVQGRIAAVGPAAMPLRDYLQCLRRQLGLPRARVVAVPMRFMLGLGAVLGDWAGWADRDTMRMLARGNRADPAAFERLLGRRARACECFIAAPDRRDTLARIRIGHAATALRLALAALWLLSGIVSLGLFPIDASLALLHASAVPPAMAPFALYAAAGLDLYLGLRLLLAPRGRRAYGFQLLVIAAYTAVIASTQPAFLLHPFAPIVKNLPIAAALWLLHVRERDAWNT